MDQECGRLDTARNTIKASGITPGNRDVLFRAAHDIKGQAATFGFPQVAPVADSLCRLIEHMPDIARLPLRLVDQHVDAIRAITHKNTRGDGLKYAAQLGEKLRHVTDEFLVHENRDRPDALESILAPSLVPNS
jgi:chemotaxis protein histidine kinase CheA